MSRSKWKNYYYHSKILKKKFLIHKQITIWSRNSTLAKTLNNKKLIVYNGKLYKKIYVNNLKLNFKIGEFCTTRGKFFHKNKLKPTKKNLKLKVKKK
jgi:ribosomal protein S19